MSTLSELGDFLVAAGVGILKPATNADMWLGSMPDKPNTVLVIYEYPGGMPEYIQNSFFPDRERPQIQVVARALDYQVASAFVWAAWSALAPVTNAFLGGTKYLSIRPNGSPALLKKDTDDRFLLFFNASIEKEVTVAVPS